MRRDPAFDEVHNRQAIGWDSLPPEASILWDLLGGQKIVDLFTGDFINFYIDGIEHRSIYAVTTDDVYRWDWICRIWIKTWAIWRVTEPRTTDYCARCGQSPESAVHFWRGIFGASHEFEPPARVERLYSVAWYTGQAMIRSEAGSLVISQATENTPAGPDPERP